MFSNTEELLPVISFNAKTSTDEQKKHDDFVDRMMEKGYTRKQVRLLANGICAYVNRLNNPGPVHMLPGLQRQRTVGLRSGNTGVAYSWQM